MAQTQSLFHDVPLAPPDPILGVTDAFNADQNPKKVNLGVGVYQDGQGKIPVLRTVHEAEKRWVELETSKAYLPIDEDGLLFIGLRGQAKVSTRWQTLAARGWRYLSHTFNFKL